MSEEPEAHPELLDLLRLVHTYVDETWLAVEMGDWKKAARNSHQAESALREINQEARLRAAGGRRWPLEEKE